MATVELEKVSVVRGGRAILHDISWTVGPAQRWVILGENGSGKSTLLKIAGMSMHPTTGTVRVLGNELGRTDVRELRRRVALSSAALIQQFRPTLTAAEIVVTAKNAALEPWWHSYSDADCDRARALLAQMGCGHLADEPLAQASSGERQRIVLARTLMIDPDLVLLDEPTAGLDVRGREELLVSLSELAASPSSPAIVLVTHHVEEIPPHFTHVALVRDGSMFAAGPLTEVLTSATLSAAFGLELTLRADGDRFTAALS